MSTRPTPTIAAAVESGSVEMLALLLKRPDADEHLTTQSPTRGGTPHYRALAKLVEFASYDQAEWAVPNQLECARLLREHGAPVEHRSFVNPVATVWRKATPAHRSLHRSLGRPMFSERLLRGIARRWSEAEPSRAGSGLAEGRPGRTPRGWRERAPRENAPWESNEATRSATK